MMNYFAVFAVATLSSCAGATFAIRIVCNRALATIRNEVKA